MSFGRRIYWIWEEEAARRRRTMPGLILDRILSGTVAGVVPEAEAEAEAEVTVVAAMAVGVPEAAEKAEAVKVAAEKAGAVTEVAMVEAVTEAAEKMEKVPEAAEKVKAVPEAEVPVAAAMAKVVPEAAEKAEAVPEAASPCRGVVAAPQRVPTSPRCSPAATAFVVSDMWPRAPPRVANEVMGARAWNQERQRCEGRRGPTCER